MADKFVPLEKMSKKNRREFYSKQRRDWNGLNPVTRTADKPKKYSRVKQKSELSRTEL